ncbi:MAG: hypothetical protein Q9190_003144 [Brigantiaea leucoxantha]
MSVPGPASHPLGSPYRMRVVAVSRGDAEVYAFFAHHYDYWTSRLELDRSAWECVGSIAQLAYAEGFLRTCDLMKLFICDLMKLFISDPRLEKMNRMFFQRKVKLFEDQALLGNNSWNGWKELAVLRTVDETEGIKSFYLEPTERASLAAYLPGQSVTVKLADGAIQRWSISDWTSRDKPQYYRISIKRGIASSKWMPNSLSLCRPTGSFTLDWKPLFPLRQIYISAGIGILLIVTMLKAHLSHKVLKQTPPVWIHVAHNKADFPFEIQKTICGRIFFTSPRSGMDLLMHDYHEVGRPTASFFKDLIESSYFMDPMQIRPVQIPGCESICYICGPPSFEKDIRCILKASGVSDQNIRSEVFSNSGVPVANDENGPISNSEQNLQPNLRDATVRFTKSGKSAAWTCKEDCSILELAEKTGLMPEYRCRAGVCGSCVATLGSGKVCGQGQRGDGTLLLCTAKPATGEVSIEIILEQANQLQQKRKRQL